MINIFIKIGIGIVTLVIIFLLCKSMFKDEEKRVKKIIEKSFDDMEFRHKLLKKLNPKGQRTNDNK